MMNNSYTVWPLVWKLWLMIEGMLTNVHVWAWLQPVTCYLSVQWEPGVIHMYLSEVHVMVPNYSICLVCRKQTGVHVCWDQQCSKHNSWLWMFTKDWFQATFHRRKRQSQRSHWLLWAIWFLWFPFAFTVLVIWHCYCYSRISLYFSLLLISVNPTAGFSICNSSFAV